MLRPDRTHQNLAASLWQANAEGLLDKDNFKGTDLLKAQKDLEQNTQNREIRHELSKITENIRSSIEETNISKLDKEIGGQFSKAGIELNQNIFQVENNSPQAIAEQLKITHDRVKLVFNHEKQHQIHNDELPITLFSKDQIIQLGGNSLTLEEFTEGANMTITGTKTDSGEQFVSNSYKEILDKFSRALSSSQYSITDISKALQNRDLTTIDDRNKTS